MILPLLRTFESRVMKNIAIRPPRATITFLFYGRYPVHYKMPPAVLSGSAALAMLHPDHFDANDFDFYVPSL